MVVLEMTSGTPYQCLLEKGVFALVSFISHEEQIKRIQEKNITVKNIDFAKMVLSNVSYSSFMNGYKEIYQTNEDGKFSYPIDFETIYTVYTVDCSLHSMFLKHIIHIERSLKNKIAHLVAEKHGVNTDQGNKVSRDEQDYLCLSHYSNSNNKRDNIIRRLKYEIWDSRSAALRQCIEQNESIPPWLLASEISFGDTIQWYSILKDDDKSKICNSFIGPNIDTQTETKKEFCIKAFDLLREYRNAFAHGQRTYAREIKIELPAKPLLSLAPPKTISKEDYKQGKGKNDIVAVLLALIILTNDPYQLVSIAKDISYVFGPYSHLKVGDRSLYSVFNFPENGTEWLNIAIDGRLGTI